MHTGGGAKLYMVIQRFEKQSTDLTSTQDIVQPERGGDLRVSLPRLHVLESQMVKDVLFSPRCQELLLKRTNTQSVRQ